MPGMQIVQQASKVFVNAADYATPDGTTDNTTGLQAAITAASLASGALFIPSGTWIVSADLIPTSNMFITGAGKGTVLKAKASTQPNIFNLTGLSHVMITNLQINGNKTNVTSLGIQYTHESGVYIVNADDIIVTNCFIHDCAVSGIMANGNSTNLTFTHNRMTNNYDNQIYVRAKDQTPYTPCTYVVIANNICSGGSFSGAQCLGSSHITMANNVCYANGPTMGQGDGVGSEGCSDITFIGNVCYNNGVQGVNVRGTTEVGTTQISSHVQVTGNTCYGNTSTNGDAGGISITDADDVNCTGNLCYSNGFGINVTDVMSQGASHIFLANNTVRGGSNTGIRISPSSGVDFILRDNYVTDNSGDNLYTTSPVFVDGGVYSRANASFKEGIHLASGSNNSRIWNVHAYDNFDSGIVIDSPVSGTEIRNCLFDNLVGTHQARALQEQAGAGPTKMVNCRILNQASNPYTFNNTASRYYDEQTCGTTTQTGSPYVVTALDEVVLCNRGSAMAVTIPNPSNSNGRVITVKDISGAANTNNITLTSASGNIDGAGTKVINTAYGVVRLITDGTNWFTI